MELIEKIKSKKAHIGVIGLGYVGLPLVIEFCKAGFQVTGFDIDPEKVKLLSQGKSYIKHIDSSRITDTGSRFIPTTDFSKLSAMDCIIICVPTPLNKYREPDMSYVFNTTKTIAGNLRKGQLIVLESTTYPGTTDEDMRPMLEEAGLKAGEDFYSFVSKSSLTTDIFCLSEVQPELFSKLEFMLPHFRGFYEVGRFDKVMGLTYGQAAFVKRGIEAQILGKVDTFRNVYNDMGFAMPLVLTINQKPTYLMNVHGKARPGHKLDTPARARQSQKIINFLKSKEGPKIIGGDFNLMPSTYAVRLFEKEDYRNLIKDFEILELIC